MNFEERLLITREDTQTHSNKSKIPYCVFYFIKITNNFFWNGKFGDNGYSVLPNKTELECAIYYLVIHRKRKKEKKKIYIISTCLNFKSPISMCQKAISSNLLRLSTVSEYVSLVCLLNPKDLILIKNHRNTSKFWLVYQLALKGENLVLHPQASI